MQNFQEKIRQVDSKVASLSAKVDDFERSHITADEMQGQVHEMREDLDRLRTRVERMKLLKSRVHLARSVARVRTSRGNFDPYIV